MTNPNPDLIQVKEAFLKGEVYILDVREKNEWDEAHIEGADLFPLSEMKEGNLPENLPTDKPVYTHCRRGVRAQEAAWILGADFDNVTALCFEFSQFEKAGFPITRSEPVKANN